MLCAVVLLFASGSRAQERVNPVLDSGADPWVTFSDGFYYYTQTMGDRLQIWKTDDLAKLRTASTKVVWSVAESGPKSAALWAPELHRLQNKWYLYFTAADKLSNDDEHRHIFVLENAAVDPMEGAWTDRGMLLTQHTGIDGTVFMDRGQLYFVYSAYVGSDSDLVIAKMANPWTLSGDQVDMARPTFDWEKRGGRQILEAPEYLAGKLGQHILVYSASACWSDDYSIGMLVAAPNANLLDASSWKKIPEPVFKKSAANNVFAPGHNGFFKSRDGRQDWIIYHANTGPGQRCDRRRSPRIQPFRWGADGLPQFGAPVAAGAIPSAAPPPAAK
jgi:GH43 family beta-xylosidase